MLPALCWRHVIVSFGSLVECGHFFNLRPVGFVLRLGLVGFCWQLWLIGLLLLFKRVSAGLCSFVCGLLGIVGDRVLVLVFGVVFVV